MDTDHILPLLQKLEWRKVRQILNNDADGSYKHLDLLKYFASNEAVYRDKSDSDTRWLIAYTLVDYECTHQGKYEIEHVLDDALRLAIESNDEVVCDVVLQAGANLFAAFEAGVEQNEEIQEPSSSFTIYDRIMTGDNDDIKALVDKYFPGVWSAVKSENIGELRRLVNNWCSTDIYQNGVHLTDLALSTGHEPIIRLVTGVCATMKLIRAIKAGNANAVGHLLENNLKDLHLDFRNMSDEGAPLLYYVIEREEVTFRKVLYHY